MRWRPSKLPKRILDSTERLAFVPVCVWYHPLKSSLLLPSTAAFLQGVHDTYFHPHRGFAERFMDVYLLTVYVCVCVRDII